MEMVFEYIEDPGIVITRAQAQTTTERLTLASFALGKMAHAYDYGHNGEAAQARDRWALLTVGAIAALEYPAEYYRQAGEDPARAAVLGGRISLAMRHSRWGVREDELGQAMAIATTQGVPRSEFPDADNARDARDRSGRVPGGRGERGDAACAVPDRTDR